jgi:hypothetical protein
MIYMGLLVQQVSLQMCIISLWFSNEVVQMSYILKILNQRFLNFHVLYWMKVEECMFCDCLKGGLSLSFNNNGYILKFVSVLRLPPPIKLTYMI